MANKLVNFHKGFWILVVVLFSASLIFPTTADSDWPKGFDNGLIVLVFGFFYLPEGGVYLTWLANPFMILVFIFSYKKPYTSLYLSIVAFVIALNFLRGGIIDTTLYGNPVPITGFGLGYWLWLTSMVVAVFASVLSIKASQKIPS